MTTNDVPATVATAQATFLCEPSTVMRLRGLPKSQAAAVTTAEQPRARTLVAP
jgi:hypothetical protein